MSETPQTIADWAAVGTGVIINRVFDRLGLLE
jgi:hypothetical protein